ncbi:MAG: hypothetical protein AAF655_25100 [Bacteroidota bacterium]
MRNHNRKSGLELLPEVFRALHQAILTEFRNEYQISPETLLDYQLYGFNNYDENLPSVKQLILDRTGKWVNGKYLYNKYREYKKGASPIRFTREFVFVYFKTLGFSSVNEFLSESSLSKVAINEQLNQGKPIEVNEEPDYYVGYYIGEEGKIIGTRLTVLAHLRKVVFCLYYWEREDEVSEYVYEGTLHYQPYGMSFFFNSSDNPLARSMHMAMFCENQTIIKPYLISAYSGYDRDRNPVLGEIILERVEDEETQMKMVKKLDVHPIIAQHLSGKRWVIDGKTPQNLVDFSPASAFASIIESFISSYRGVFISLENGTFVMELNILDKLGDATLHIAGHPLYRGSFAVQASGQLLVGRFKNIATHSPIFMTIQVVPSRGKLFQGDLLGVSRFDKSFTGRLYLSHDETFHEKIPSYRGSQLTDAEISSLPEEILQDIVPILKNNTLEKNILKKDPRKDHSPLRFVKGEYSFMLSMNSQEVEGSLRISARGKAQMNIHDFRYEGKATVCEGMVLSVYFHSCNGISHCAHLIGKLVRKGVEIEKSFPATLTLLDEQYRPQNYEISLVDIAVEDLLIGDSKTRQ